MKLDNLLSDLKEVLTYVFSESETVISYTSIYEEGNKMTDFTLENSN